MCQVCAKTLLLEINSKVCLSKYPFIKCLTPGCSTPLELGFLCTAYHNKNTICTSKKSIEIKKERNAISFLKNCNNAWEVRNAIGLSSPCDACIYDGTYRIYEKNLKFCPNCGFYIRKNGEIGYTEKFANNPLINYHHNEILDKAFTKAEHVLIAGGDLSEDEKYILEIEGIYSKGGFTPNGIGKIRDRIQQKAQKDSWIENMLKDRIAFIARGGKFRASAAIYTQAFSPVFGSAFVDVNLFIAGTRKDSSQKLYKCITEPCKQCDPLYSCHLSSNSIILVLIMKSQLLCKTNQLAMSELLSKLYNQKPSAESIDYYMFLWEEFQKSIEIYNWDDGTMQASTVIAELYSEFIGKDADIKDVYHYVFSVQNKVDYIASWDKFMKNVPEFREKIIEYGIEKVTLRAIELYSSDYPYTNKLYNIEDLKFGFENLLTSEIEIMDSEKFLQALRDKHPLIDKQEKK